MRWNEQTLRTIFDAVPDSIVVIDEGGVIQELNDSTLRDFGYGSRDELIGQDVSVLVGGPHRANHRSYVQRYRETGEAHILGKDRLAGEAVRKDGSTFPIRLNVSEFVSDGSRYFLGICHDATELSEAMEETRWLAEHDALTEVRNRHAVTRALAEAIVEAEAEKTQIAVLFIDLDKFKLVNDNFGHIVGDQVLVRTTERIHEALRPQDVLGRVGGDEFVAILRLDGEAAASETAASNIASRLVSSLDVPFEIHGTHVTLSASVGIAMFPTHAQAADELINFADTAMFDAKHDDAISVRVFDNRLRLSAEERYRILTRLRDAVTNGRLELWYQPQFDMRTLEVVGMEALIRWNDPELGLVMPDAFLPLAQADGLMPTLGQWVVHRACADNAHLIAENVLDVPVAVNIDVPLFQTSGFIPLVEEVLLRTGLPANRLEVELTESVAMDLTPQIRENVLRLSQLGVTLAMDDFGTGYSSLQSLKDHRFHRLKVDRGFTSQVPGSERDEAIVRALIEMGNALGMEAVIEGVETAEQLEFLRDISCRVGQGFWYARPMPVNLLLPWLMERGRVPLDSAR